MDLNVGHTDTGKLRNGTPVFHITVYRHEKISVDPSEGPGRTERRRLYADEHVYVGEGREGPAACSGPTLARSLGCRRMCIFWPIAHLHGIGFALGGGSGKL